MISLLSQLQSLNTTNNEALQQQQQEQQQQQQQWQRGKPQGVASSYRTAL